MKTASLISGWIALFCVFVATPSFGQADEPDLEVQKADISFNPASPVLIGTVVEIKADIHNRGNCYIALSENLDEVGYNENFTMLNRIKVKARVRSTNGDILGVEARIDDYPIVPFYTSSQSWEVKESNDITIPSQNNTTLFLKRVSGGGSSDLEIDYIEVWKWNGSGWDLLLAREGESYDSGGGSVDRIHPSGVKVDFYDGDPAYSGCIHLDTRTVGDVQKDTEAGPTWILTEGGSAEAKTDWQAVGGHWHYMYVEITPDPKETMTDNNKAFKKMEVLPGHHYIWWYIADRTGQYSAIP